jgi:hypothetical protein
MQEHFQVQAGLAAVLASYQQVCPAQQVLAVKVLQVEAHQVLDQAQAAVERVKLDTTIIFLILVTVEMVQPILILDLVSLMEVVVVVAHIAQQAVTLQAVQVVVVVQVLTAQ